MAVLEDPPVRPGLADQSQVRTTVPAADAHDDQDHDDQHDGEHAFAWPEAARIAFVALAAAAVWFRVWEPLASVSRHARQSVKPTRILTLLRCSGVATKDFHVSTLRQRQLARFSCSDCRT